MDYEAEYNRLKEEMQEQKEESAYLREELKDGYYIIRKLTVRECMRLQTVPEWYEFPVSDSQAYKMLGNGWTCEVIAHIMKYFKDA